MNPARVLGMFAKKPVPGQVKTRLANATSPDFAARVAEACLRDSLARLSRIAVLRVLAYAPAGAEQYFIDCAPGWTLQLQAEGDLGRRLERFFTEWLGQADAVIVVGTDSPTLPLPLVEEAFSALASHDVVLGPATDGGYYLLGCRRPIPGLFDAIAWSTANVLAETASRIKAVRASLHLLPPWYDVDTLDDWCMLRGHLLARVATGQPCDLPWIREVLEGWDSRHRA